MGVTETDFATCPNCGFQFYTTRPTYPQVYKFYRGYRGKKYQQQRERYEPTYTKEFNDNLDNPQTVKERVKNITRFIKGVKSVLDYGGGTGLYIPDVENKYVYEISHNKLETGVKQWGGEPVDLVMCCHLLEHVSDPVGLVKELRLLGKVYIEVPNKKPLKPIMHEHINFFTPKSLEIMTGGKFGVVKLKSMEIICGVIDTTR